MSCNVLVLLKGILFMPWRQHAEQGYLTVTKVTIEYDLKAIGERARVLS